MVHLARQESSVDDGSSSTNIDISDTGVPSSAATLGSSDVAATQSSPSVTADPSATDSAATTAATDSSSITAAASTPDSTAPPTSQVTSGGASDATITTASFTDSSQSLGEPSVTSDPGSSASVSNSQPSLTTVTDSASATLTSSFSQSTALSDTSTFLSSTVSIPSSTAESTSTSESSSTTDSTSTESPTASSSSVSSSGTRSPSLTTSFTEVISTVNGQVTTIFSPVATLNAETSTTVTSSNRTAVIAGVTAGSAALIILLLLGIFLYRRHQKRKSDQLHRYLPTPRSVMLSGEDDFDLAGPQPQQSFGIFGSGRKNHGGGSYRDLGSDSGRGASSSVMRELPTEPPPRLLRPVASKTGSYFQEGVWPPPGEGSRLSDPLMAASQVDLHSIVDEVMGQSSQPGRSSIDASSSSSPPHASRLRGGATERSSLLSDSQNSTDFSPHVPLRHGGSPTMSSSIDSGFGEPPHHLRDWSTDSATGLLANVEGSSRGTRRTSGSSGAWLPPGAAPPSAYGRPMSPLSPLRLVTEPRQNNGTAPSSRSSRARGKASEAAQERRGSMTLANPSPDDENASSSVHTQSFSVSTTSTQRLCRLTGTLEATGEGTPYPDESPIDRRSVPPSLAHGWLLDVDDENNEPTPRPGQRQRDEIPPRYDMIRRDSEDGIRTRTTAL